jgi:hypothetical protein
LVELQELVTRGRFLFSGAPGRLEVFKFVNGTNSTKDIARKTRRPLESVLHDLQKLVDMELIREMRDTDGRLLRKEGATVFEKAPLARHIPISYFIEVADTTKLMVKSTTNRTRSRETIKVHIPSEVEILEICKSGEDQSYEFKAPGVDTDKLTKEVAGFLHTRNGGVIFYGIDDDGTLVGSDVRRQDFDQKIHNSIRNTISPQPTVEVSERGVMGTVVLMILVPPWDRKTIYQDTKDGRYYIRRGTNIFALKPDELRKLTEGTYVV